MIVGFKNAVLFLSISYFVVGCASDIQTKRKPSGGSVSSRESTPQDPESLNQQPFHESYFDWPVDQARLSRGFLPKKRRPHLGIDLAALKGTPILAAHNGRVIYTGNAFKGFGKLVMIEGSRGWATFYAHLSKITIKEGDRILKGQIIGEMGRTGRATGVHLHFEIRGASGPVDPLLYLPAAQRLAHN